MGVIAGFHVAAQLYLITEAPPAQYAAPSIHNVPLIDTTASDSLAAALPASYTLALPGSSTIQQWHAGALHFQTGEVGHNKHAHS
jgi:hypothetical protein